LTKNETIMRKLTRYCLILTLLALIPLWLSSYHLRSAIGFEQEQRQGEQVHYHYYRIAWPGNGSLLIGHGISTVPYHPEQTYDAFDIAASFFKPPRPQWPAQSLWNRLGFWYVNEPAPVNQYWLGVPSWLPVVLVGLWLACVSSQSKFRR